MSSGADLFQLGETKKVRSQREMDMEHLSQKGGKKNDEVIGDHNLVVITRHTEVCCSLRL